MIESIKHKALRDFWIKDHRKGLDAKWLRKLRQILLALDAASRPEDMKYPGSYFHALSGDQNGRFSIRLTANYRFTFGWGQTGTVDVNIEDYH